MNRHLLKLAVAGLALGGFLGGVGLAADKAEHGKTEPRVQGDYKLLDGLTEEQKTEIAGVEDRYGEAERLLQHGEHARVLAILTDTQRSELKKMDGDAKLKGDKEALHAAHNFERLRDLTDEQKKEIAAVREKHAEAWALSRQDEKAEICSHLTDAQVAQYKKIQEDRMHKAKAAKADEPKPHKP